MADGLEKLKKRLYGQSKNLAGRFKKNTLAELRSYPQGKEVSSEWAPVRRAARASMAPMTKFVVLLSVFVAVVAVGALVYLFGGFGAISSGNINFSITGPQSINGGDKVSWRVVLENKNSTALESAEVIFHYPEASRPVARKTAGPLVERKSLGRIAAGSYAEATFDAFVFGEEGGTAGVSATLEYRMEGSNAILAKEAASAVHIVTAPVSVSVSVPEFTNIGQEVEVDVTYISNAKEDISGLVLETVYPDGFEFVSASPAPSFSNNTWEIGGLSPQTQKTIRIKGRISGENLDSRLFKSSVGLRSGDGILSVYGAGAASTTLRKPFLDISLTINNKDEYTAKAGEGLMVEVHWKNNLPVAVRNLILEIGLQGRALDERSIYVNRGFFRGSDHAVVWNSSSYPTFAFVPSGQEGVLTFSANVLNNLPVQSAEDINFSVKLNAHMYAGERPQGFEGVDIDGRFAREVKVSSDLQLSSRGYYYYSLLPNYGPLPPKAGAETSYTVVWSLANSSNNLRNVKVYASLPSYMRWAGHFLPSGEDVSFDESSGRIVWKLGDLSAGTGILRPAREAAFQLAITPSLAQVGSMPVLVSEVTAEGEDAFTGVMLRDIKSAITTRLFSDMQVKSGGYEVVN